MDMILTWMHFSKFMCSANKFPQYNNMKIQYIWIILDYAPHTWEVLDYLFVPAQNMGCTLNLW